MNKIDKKEWLTELENGRAIDPEERNALWWESTFDLIEQVQTLCAENMCRYCYAYGKPEIKPGSWVHLKDRTGETLPNPQTCAAAVIWAAELIEE